MNLWFILEFLEKVLGIFQTGLWFPAIVFGAETFPFDKPLMALAFLIVSLAQNSFDFPFFVFIVVVGNGIRLRGMSRL